MTISKTSISLSALMAILLTGAAFAQNATDVSTEAASETAETMVKEVSVEKTEGGPDLEEISAADPNLDIRKGQEGEADAMVMLSDVLFEFGDAELEVGALETLQTVAEKLENIEALEIKGHTDAIGSDAYNLALGQQRADAVRLWLIENSDLNEEAIVAVGVGEADPIATNANEDGTDNPEGRAKNRRVEFILPK